MVGWHHSLNGHEFEQTLVDSEEQGNSHLLSLTSFLTLIQLSLRASTEELMLSNCGAGEES